MSATTVPVLTPPVEITEASLPDLQAACAPHMQGTGPGVVLDLGAVEFINSAGLAELVRAGMRLDGQGRRLTLARPNKTIDRMLKLIGLDAKLPVFRTVEEASGFLTNRAARHGT